MVNITSSTCPMSKLPSSKRIKSRAKDESKSSNSLDVAKMSRDKSKPISKLRFPEPTYSRDHRSWMCRVLSPQGKRKKGPQGRITVRYARRESAMAGGVAMSIHERNEDREWYSAEQLQREYRYYQRLPVSHSRLLTLREDSTPERLVFPDLRNGTLDAYVERHRPLCLARFLQLSADAAAEGVGVLHTHEVIHMDMFMIKFLVNDNERLCVIDFASSSIDGNRGLGLESDRHFRPRQWDDPPAIVNDLLALGTILHEVLIGYGHLENLTDAEVRERFCQKEWPSVSALHLVAIIERCRNCEYESAKQVYDDVTQVTVLHESSSIEISQSVCDDTSSSVVTVPPVGEKRESVS